MLDTRTQSPSWRHLDHHAASWPPLRLVFGSIVLSHIPAGYPRLCDGQWRGKPILGTEENDGNNVILMLGLSRVILLMADILQHLGCKNTCKYWDKLPINQCRISSINSSNVNIPIEMVLFEGGQWFPIPLKWAKNKHSWTNCVQNRVPHDQNQTCCLQNVSP